MLKHSAALGVLLITGLLAAGQHKDRSLNEDPDARSVQGIVEYAAHEPVKGAVVKCEDMNTLEIRSYVTEADGRYHFMNLSVNHDYELKAEKSGRESGTKRLTKFNERKEATVNLQLK